MSLQLRYYWTHMGNIKSRLVGILRWSERFTKTDMVYLAKGGSWLGLGQAVTSFAAFLLSIAFANLFPREAYGEYRYIFSIVGVVSAFSLTGMDMALSQSIARGFDGTLSRSVRMAFLWSLIASAGLCIVSAYYFSNHNSTLGWALIIAAIATPLLKSFNLYSAFLLGKKDFGRRTRYGMFYDILPAATIALALTYTDNAIVIVATYFISYTLVTSVLYILTKRVYRPEGPIDENVGTYSKHLSVMNIVGTASFQLDKILTFHYLGSVQLALYSFAIGIPQQLRQTQKIIGSLAFPRFATRNHDDLRTALPRKSLILFLGMLAIVVVYIPLAPTIFTLLFPNYLEAVPYSQVFSLVLLFAPGALYQQVLTAQQNKKALYVIQTVGAPIRIGSLFLFIPLFGIWGILLSTFINEIVRMIFVVYFIHSKKAWVEEQDDFLTDGDGTVSIDEKPLL